MGPCTVSCLFPQRDRKPLRWWDSGDVLTCSQETDTVCFLRFAPHPSVLARRPRSRQEAAGATHQEMTRASPRRSETELIFIAWDVTRTAWTSSGSVKSNLEINYYWLPLIYIETRKYLPQDSRVPQEKWHQNKISNKRVYLCTSLPIIFLGRKLVLSCQWAQHLMLNRTLTVRVPGSCDWNQHILSSSKINI